MMTTVNERAYFQRRTREEIARCLRFRDVFGLITLQAVPTTSYTPNRRLTQTAARLLERRLRTSDVVDAIDEDTITVLLVGTGRAGLRDAEQRVRAALVRIGGSWQVHEYLFPEHADVIRGLDILTAA